MDLLVRMRLLGGFALRYQNTPVMIPSQRIQALLAYLVLHRGEAQPRQRLAFLLWPDSSESQAYTNLRTLLHRLHVIFPQSDHLLQIDSQVVCLYSAAVLDLDVDHFEQAVQMSNAIEQGGGGASALAALEGAVSVYAGDLLPDCYDEWLIPERERLRQSLFTTLERLVILLEQRRAYSAAIPYASRLVSLEPINEVACFTLMRLHTLNGDRASALRVYHSCVSALQSELGTQPGTALHKAYERLLMTEEDSPLSELSAAVPLVGRDREWKRMQATWQVVASGQSRLLILWGEAGIGKTHLAETFLNWAKRQGSMTAIARCYAAEGNLAYAPVTSLLRSEALRPSLMRLNAEWLSEIARLEPDLLTTRPDLRRPGPLSEQWQRQRLFDALARVVVASERPVMLLVDDLQWCDRDTLEWLHFLLRYELQTRLLIVGTARIEEVTVDGQLLPLLQSLRHENRATEITLNPLSREETIKLAAHIAGHRFNQERMDFLYSETEGNPLFVVETLRELLSEWESAETVQASSHGGGGNLSGLPSSVQAIIMQRLSHLSPAARTVLEVAAVIGRSFTFNVIARAVDQDEDTLVQGLDELWQRRIVREQGSEGYDFTHGKLRAVAYGELSAARQRVLHRRVAQALETEHDANLDGVSGQIAAHYEQAGFPAQAVAYYQRAAEFARHLHANDIAILHLRRALALLGDQQLAARRLYDELGDVLHFIGRYDEALDVWGRALNLTPPDERVARAELYRKLGNAWRDQHRYDEAQNAYNAAEAALGSLHDDDDQVVWSCLGQIKIERINVFYWTGQTGEMLRLIAQTQLMLAEHGSPLQRARLHQLGGVYLLRAYRYDTMPEAVEHARAYLHMLNEIGEVDGLPSAHFQLGFTLLWAGNDLAGAEQAIQTALALAEQGGDVSLEGRCLTYLTVIARLRNQIEQVAHYNERSLRAAEAGQMYDYIGAARGHLAWLDWRNGDSASAHAHGYAALEAWQQLPAGYMFEWIGRLPIIAAALTRDDLAEAVTQARVLLAERQKRLPAPVDSALEAAVRAADTDDLAASHAFLRQAAESAREYGYL
jgi:DNA-binding SARP family transcriptional activator/tetratricopeptide (TPR) repeat protein